MRKRCIRKHWQLVSPIQHAIEGAAITDDERLNKLRLLELSALEAFAKGKATPTDWRSLADMLNVAETLALSGVGPEVLQACETAQNALAEAYRRHEELGKLGVTGPELQALRDLHEYHDLQRSSIPRSQYEQGIRDTANRIRSAHPGVKVFV
jgi:hypothetical protein